MLRLCVVVAMLFCSLRADAAKAGRKDVVAIEDAADQYFQALQAGRWSEAVALVDRRELAEARDSYADAIERAEGAAQEQMLGFLGYQRIGQVRRSEPGEFLVRLLGRVTELDPSFAATLGKVRVMPVGVVFEPPQTAFMVYRAAVRRGQRSSARVNVLELHEVADRWRIALSDDLRDVVRALFAVLGGGSRAPGDPPDVR